MGWFTRVYEHPKFIPLLAAAVVLALGLAGFGVVHTLAQDADVLHLGAQHVATDAGGQVGGDAVVIDVVLPAGQSARVDDIRARLAPILDNHARAVAEVALTECEKTVPGASTTTPTTGRNP